MKRLLVFGIPIVLILGLVFWRLSAEKAAAQEAASQQGSRKNAVVSADMAEAAPATLSTTLEAVGTVQSPYKVDLSPRTAGRIDFLEVREGDHVQVGQVVVRINPSDLEGAALQQQAAVAEARAKLAEAQISKSSNDVAIQGNVRQQQANLATAKAELLQAKQTYEAQVQSAQSNVVDATAKVKAAQSDIRNNQAKVASAQADADNAKLKYERLERLLKSGYVAAQNVDDARADYQVAEKGVDVAEAQLDASRSALDSANPQLDSAKQQLEIAKKKADVDVQTAAARVNQAQAALDIAKANRSGSAAYSENLAALEASVKSAEAQLAQAQAKQADTVLKSSIEGTVTARNADPGSMASPGSAVVTIQYLKWLFVTASLPIENADAVHIGQEVKLSFDAFPGRTWIGKISQVNPAADPQSRQFSFQVRLDNPDGAIRPGMYAKANIIISRVQAAVAVPKGAVDDSSGKPQVKVVDSEGVVSTRAVEIGQSDATLTEIRSGLKVGEKVVTLSYSPLKDGSKIRLPKQGEGKTK